MRKQIVALGLLFFAGLLALACVSNTQAQRSAATDAGNGWQKTAAQPIPSAYKLSGPYSHKNLTVFLIHGNDNSSGKTPLTLQEAMASQKVKVIETSNVNELAIENVSDEEVFVQSGDIVKGGKQDRVLAMDFIVPPHSGKLPIDSFCVEHGRWQQRGGESALAFSSSDQMLNHKDLKIAAKSKKSQQEVWDKVAESQMKLSENVAVAASPAPLADANNVQGNIAARRVEVASSTSRSSLQLTLENKAVKETADEYSKALASAMAGKKDVIGYAFAINGNINSADVYSSHALFAKLWPKLLKASAIEAIAEFDQSRQSEAVSVASVQAFLTEAEMGAAEQKQITPQVELEKRESDKNLFFETRNRQNGEKWLHRNYLKK